MGFRSNLICVKLNESHSIGEIFGNKDYLRDNKCLSSIEYIDIKRI